MIRDPDRPHRRTDRLSPLWRRRPRSVAVTFGNLPYQAAEAALCDPATAREADARPDFGAAAAGPPGARSSSTRARSARNVAPLFCPSSSTWKPTPVRGRQPHLQPHQHSPEHSRGLARRCGQGRRSHPTRAGGARPEAALVPASLSVHGRDAREACQLGRRSLGAAMT